MALSPTSSHGSGTAGVATDGWVADSSVWTYASATTFTVPTDLTTTYTPGTRLKLTQSASVKYFVVVSSAFGASTTVTITGGSDYTLANAAISANSYSYEVNPQGWPGWFNYAPAATGYGSKTNDVARFSVTGRTCTVVCVIGGTSNATTLTFTAPIACSANALALTNGQAAVTDNGAASSDPGRLFILSSGSTITAFKDYATSAFTNSGTKNCNGFIAYEI